MQTAQTVGSCSGTLTSSWRAGHCPTGEMGSKAWECTQKLKDIRKKTVTIERGARVKAEGRESREEAAATVLGSGLRAATAEATVTTQCTVHKLPVAPEFTHQHQHPLELLAPLNYYPFMPTSFKSCGTLHLISSISFSRAQYNS